MASSSRLSRLIDLVPYIAKHQGISIKELAAKFNISVDELEKDLWLLYCCGLPGQTPLELMEFSFEDGYVTVRNADELRTPRSLTQIELATLIVGLDLLAANGNQVALDLKAKLAAKFSSQIAYTPNGTERHVPEIQKAIQSNAVLKISYLGKVREIIPFEIYEDRGATYLRAYCKLAKDRRTFKLSRIDSLEITNSKELAPNIVENLEEQKICSIRTHEQSRRVRETLGDAAKVQFFSEEWLIGELMALGGAVEVLDNEIRSKLRDRAVASQNLYLG